MSLLRRRLVPVVLFSSLAVFAAGCAGAPGSSGPADPSPGGPAPASSSPEADDRDQSDIEVVWLDDGRGIGIVTWGSSSADCQPQAAESTADGQAMTVVLSEAGGEDAACTLDLVPRAVFAAVPDGVDVTQDVEVRVSYGDLTADDDLDALDAAPQGPGAQQPSASRFDDEGIVLLTWGSSSCRPRVDDVELTDDGATVTFAQLDGPCTADLAPRATVISLPADAADDDRPFTLTLRGADLDGTVEVRS